MLWLFTGDSITQGAAHIGEARSYPQLFEEWIRYQMGRSHDFVVNTAISGQPAIFASVAVIRTVETNGTWPPGTYNPTRRIG